MLQQINLYREPKQQQIILPLYQMIIINLGFVGILFIISIYMFYDYYKTALELQQLQAKQSNLNKGLASVQKTAPTEEDKKKLETTLSNLQEAKEYRQKMYTTLAQLHYQDSSGLVEYLNSMAEPNIPDLWLTKFYLANNGSSVTLEGITVNSSSVPAYLQALGKTKIFKGRTFDKLQIFFDEKSKQTKFIIGS